MKKYINRSTWDAYTYEEVKEAFEMYKDEIKEKTLEDHIAAHFDVEEWDDMRCISSVIIKEEGKGYALYINNEMISWGDYEDIIATLLDFSKDVEKNGYSFTLERYTECL